MAFLVACGWQQRPRNHFQSLGIDLHVQGRWQRRSVPELRLYRQEQLDCHQTYTFTTGEVISPAISGAYDIHSEVSGSLVNPSGTGTLLINPALSDGDGDGIAELQAVRLSSDGGVTFVNAGVDAGQKVTLASTTTSQGYGIYNADTSGSGSFNYWAVETKFTLSPNKDVASLSGYVEITPVPEPAGSAMLLAGLGLIGFIVRRRT